MVLGSHTRTFNHHKSNSAILPGIEIKNSTSKFQIVIITENLEPSLRLTGLPLSLHMQIFIVFTQAVACDLQL